MEMFVTLAASTTKNSIIWTLYLKFVKFIKINEQDGRLRSLHHCKEANFRSIIPMKLELSLGIIDQQAKWQILSALVPR